jgi:hypothetical protein
MRKETDLYGPVKAFLEAQEFIVKGEVKGCDLVAVRGDDLVVVELKRQFNVTLILQGVHRQVMTDWVYLAVEAPKGRSRWTEYVGLCRRLGFGLLAGRFLKAGPQVDVACEPAPFTPRKNAKRRALLLKEFHRRSGDHNVGGSTGRQLMTAYREEALLLAQALAAHDGPLTTRELRARTGIAKTTQILADNYYGWFEKVEKATYVLLPAGREALITFAHILAGARP